MNINFTQLANSFNNLAYLLCQKQKHSVLYICYTFAYSLTGKVAFVTSLCCIFYFSLILQIIFLLLTSLSLSVCSTDKFLQDIAVFCSKASLLKL